MLNDDLLLFDLPALFVLLTLYIRGQQIYSLPSICENLKLFSHVSRCLQWTE